jgi:hypothetical protein
MPLEAAIETARVHYTFGHFLAALRLVPRAASSTHQCRGLNSHSCRFIALFAPFMAGARRAADLLCG